MKEIKMEQCPFCGNDHFVIGVQQKSAQVTSVERPNVGEKLYHIICEECGSIARSYVDKIDIFRN